MMLFLVVSTPAMANKDALSRAQYMIRQMNAELNQLKSTNQTLLAEKDALTKEYEKLQKKNDKLTNKSEKNKKALKGKVAEVRGQFKNEVKAHNETRRKLAKMTQEKDGLFKVATEQTQAIELCMANNKKLYEINLEVLSRYENKGVWDSVTQAEPFSRLSQVQIENLVDDYQYKMDDLRVEADL